LSFFTIAGGQVLFVQQVRGLPFWAVGPQGTGPFQLEGSFADLLAIVIDWQIDTISDSGVDIGLVVDCFVVGGKRNPRLVVDACVSLRTAAQGSQDTRMAVDLLDFPSKLLEEVETVGSRLGHEGNLHFRSLNLQC
jgi:hypothetical protein